MTGKTDPFDDFAVSAKIMEAGKYFIPRDCIMKKKQCVLDKPAIVVFHRTYWWRCLSSEWNPDPIMHLKRNIQYVERAEKATDKDWVIQGDISEEMLKIIWAVLQSKLAKFWFTQTLPENTCINKTALSEFPLVFDPLDT